MALHRHGPRGRSGTHIRKIGVGKVLVNKKIMAEGMGKTTTMPRGMTFTTKKT